MALTQVSTAGVKDDAVTSGKIPADAVGSSEIAANAVGASELADNAVDTNAIANSAVTNAKIGDNAISTAKISNGQITGGKMANSAVGTTQLADDAVTSAKIATNAVGSSEIQDGNVIAAKLATGAVQTAKIADDAVTASKIADGTITSTQLANDSVTSAKIADEAVGLHKLPHGTSSNDGKFLRANNGADPTFESIPAGITINNQADNRIITATGTTDTLNSQSDLTWDGTDFLATGSSGVPKLTIENTSNSAREAAINVKGKHSNGTVRQLMLKYDSADTFRIHTGGSIPLIFETADAERMRITGNGKVGIGMTNPDDTLDVNGTFQVSSNSYMSNLYMSGSLFIGGTGSANELDDYEEGNWTPTVTFGGGTSGQGYNQQVGRYIKIGKLVHCTCYVYFNDKGSSTGSAKLSGLPFTTRNQTALYGVAEFGYWNNGSSSAGPGSISDYIGYAEINSTIINIQRQEMNQSTPAVNDATHDNFASDTDFMMAINYITN